MLADPSGQFTRALGEDMLETPSDRFGDARCRRFAAVLEGGRFKTVNIEQGPDAVCSRAEAIENQL